MKKDFCTMYLIRHGETEWNKKKIVMGHSDSPLTEEGVRQARELARILRDVKFDTVFSSDLPRALRTAEIVNEGRGLAIHTSAALRERLLGRFERKPIEVAVESIKGTFARIDGSSVEEHWHFKPEEGIESNFELVSRFMSELKVIASARTDKTVLISTHGGCIRMLLMKLEYAPYGSLPPGSFKNSGYLIIRCNRKDFEIERVEGVTTYKDNRVWG